jgi:predicted AAA+ superfamily ATPase
MIYLLIYGRPAFLLDLLTYLWTSRILTRPAFLRIPYYQNCFYWQGQKEIDFVAKEGNKLHFFEVKYQEKVSASEFQWFKKISPKGRRLSVITKQDFKKDKSISLMPAPVFLLMKGLKA